MSPLLIAAVTSGDVVQVAQVIKDGGDATTVVNGVVDKATGATALLLAAEHGHASVTHYLLLNKADVHCKRNDGKTALHLAAKGGHTPVCRLLINAGAKIGEEEADGNTALHIACLYKWPAVVKLLLLEKAADVAKPNAAGQTPKALVVDLSVDDEDAPMRQMDTFGAIREAEVHRRQLEAHRVAAASETPKTRSNAPSPGIPRRTPTRSFSNADKGTLRRHTLLSLEGPSIGSSPHAEGSSTKTPPVINASVDDHDASPSTPWTLDDMKFGELPVYKLTKKQYVVLIRLAERRIAEMLGEDVILDMMLVPNTGNKVKFYKREFAFTNQHNKGMLGVPLPVIMKSTSTRYVLETGVCVRVPFVVQQCLKFLAQGGVHTDGIFRKPGNSRRMTDLQNIFDGKPTRDVPLSEYSLHDVAGLLKRFVRELPEPIFSVRLQNLFFAAMDLADEKRRLNCLQLLIMIMPTYNRDLLQALLFLLHKVHTHADGPEGNKMTSKNLAVVFAPNMARHLDSLDKPAAAMDLQQEQQDSQVTQVLVQTLIDNCHELFRFQTTKANELPLSRKFPLAAAASSGAKTSPIVVPVKKQPTASSAVTSSSPPISAGADGDDAAESDSDSDNEAETSNTTVPLADVKSAHPAVSLNAQFLADPGGSAWPEIMANLETPTERKVRRISERVDPDEWSVSAQQSASLNYSPSSRSRMRSAGASGEVEAPIPTSLVPLNRPPVSITFKLDLHSALPSDDTPISPSAPEPTVFHGDSLNDEIARQFLKDFKKNRRFVFGDIEKREATKLFLKTEKASGGAGGTGTGKATLTDRKKSVSSPLVPQSADAAIVALLDDLEQLDLEALLRRIKDPKTGVHVKDRRRGFRLHKTVFVGRDAVDWLTIHAIPDRAVSRRQATMLGRQLLEIGAIGHVTEKEGFKDESSLYRFVEH